MNIELERVKTAVNDTRIKCLERDKQLQAAGRQLNIHDALAILAAELEKVSR